MPRFWKAMYVLGQILLMIGGWWSHADERNYSNILWHLPTLLMITGMALFMAAMDVEFRTYRFQRKLYSYKTVFIGLVQIFSCVGITGAFIINGFGQRLILFPILLLVWIIASILYWKMPDIPPLTQNPTHE